MVRTAQTSSKRHVWIVIKPGEIPLNFTLSCHGIPERCFVFRGEPMRICARCLGSTIGHCITIPLVLLGAVPPWYWSIPFIVPVAVDGLAQNKFGIMSNNPRRLVTGLLGGFGFGFLVWGGLWFSIRWAIAHLV